MKGLYQGTASAEVAHICPPLADVGWVQPVALKPLHNNPTFACLANVGLVSCTQQTQNRVVAWLHLYVRRCSFSPCKTIGGRYNSGDSELKR
jgi:hypothetical protein